MLFRVIASNKEISLNWENKNLKLEKLFHMTAIHLSSLLIKTILESRKLNTNSSATNKN